MIDAMMDMIHSEQKVDVFEFVSRIRNQRPQMVQTDVSGTSSCSGLGIVEHSGAFAPLQRPFKKIFFLLCFCYCFDFDFTVPGIAPRSVM